jgi:hypothetical protein
MDVRSNFLEEEAEKRASSNIGECADIRSSMPPLWR